MTKKTKEFCQIILGLFGEFFWVSGIWSTQKPIQKPRSVSRILTLGIVVVSLSACCSRHVAKYFVDPRRGVEIFEKKGRCLKQGDTVDGRNLAPVGNIPNLSYGFIDCRSFSINSIKRREVAFL